MQYNFSAIPNEMKTYRQWVCWKLVDRGGEKPTKIPFNALTGAMASVKEPLSWCTFDEAVFYAPQYDGIGFVLTKDDPYTFIDLDDTAGNQANLDRQLRIFKEFDSYSERSPSGTGLHIIVKGHVPNGRRRASVELYSTERYMTMTGVVFRDKPIMERQTLCQTLWAEMGGEKEKLESIPDMPETAEDQEIVRKATAAKNGQKFNSLYQGEWKDLYPSQSEADFALINIIAFWTKNRVQIKRIFLVSGLGQRTKVNRDDYIDGMIEKALTPSYRLVDIEELMPNNLQRKTFLGKQLFPIKSPCGLLGEISDFIYSSAPRPVSEIAICAAIGLVSGIVGRAYNISGTGLNHYVILVAKTGTGKEAMASGISKLMGAISSSAPAAKNFIGPSDIASGQALTKYIPNNPCFVSIIGEFGHKIRQLASSRANNSEILLKKTLLELYNKSGKDDVAGFTIAADREKSTVEVKSPAVSILAETTGETFYNVIDEQLIQDGLLPRFIIIEYTGDRPRRNREHHANHPGPVLISRLVEICVYSLQLQQNRQALEIQVNEDALAFLDSVDELVDKEIEASKDEAHRQLWSRVHVKILKLAALVAVGCDFIRPQITMEHALWAFNVVGVDLQGILKRFESGEVGKNTSEIKQTNKILRVIREYLTKPYVDCPKYITKQMYDDKVVPHILMQRSTSNIVAFKEDKAGASSALKRCINTLIDSGTLQQLSPAEAAKYSTTGKLYGVINAQNFLDLSEKLGT